MKTPAPAPQKNWFRRHPITCAIVLLVIALVAYLDFIDFFLVDTCLDRGGRWNSETRVCEYDPDKQACDQLPNMQWDYPRSKCVPK